MPTVTGTSSGGGIKKIQRGEVIITSSDITVPIDAVNTEKCQVRMWTGLDQSQNAFSGMSTYNLESNQITFFKEAFFVIESSVSYKSLAATRIMWELVEYV